MNVAFSTIQSTNSAQLKTLVINPSRQSADGFSAENMNEARDMRLRHAESKMKIAQSDLRAAEYQMKHRQEMVSTGFPSRIAEMTEQLNTAAAGEQSDIRAYIDSLKAALAEDTAWLKDNLPTWPETRASLQAQVDEQQARIDQLPAGGSNS